VKGRRLPPRLDGGEVEGVEMAERSAEIADEMRAVFLPDTGKFGAVLAPELPTETVELSVEEEVF
jgi:hypothetical protein